MAVATYSSQPDEASGYDTYIQDDTATTNYGTSALLAVGESYATPGTKTYRTLIKFDLTSIPKNANVISATLTLWVYSDDSNNERTLRVYRVLRDWVETEATWNVYSTGNNWGTAGCSNTSTDRSATDMGSRTMANNYVATQQISTTLTGSVVEGWINGTYANYGMLMQVDTEESDAYGYESSSSATAALRPKLEITYSTPGGSGWWS